jgi:hypothetical protein
VSLLLLDEEKITGDTGADPRLAASIVGIHQNLDQVPLGVE